MKILIVSKDPTHRTTAGNRWGILKQAEMLESLGSEVHFLYVRELPLRNCDMQAYETDLNACREYWGERLHVFCVSRLQKAWFNILYRLRHLLFASECGIDDDYPERLTAFVNRLQKLQQFDICIVNYYYLTKLLARSDIPVKAVFTHDYFAYKNLVVGEDILHINADSESRAIRRAEHVFAVQDEEFAYYRLIAPRSTIYNVYAIYEYCPQPVCSNHNMVFLSGGNKFNINGIRKFVREVFPLVKAEFPDACLTIGGAICSLISEFTDIEGIQLAGYVDDPALFYAGADVAINPVYQGTGLKIKTFEAVSYDKCTLVDPHSARGIFRPEEAPVFVCRTPGEWLDTLSRIWSDSSIVSRIKEKNGGYIRKMTEFVESEYNRFLDNAAG